MFLNELPDLVSAETSSFTGLADTLVPVNLASVTADIPVTFPASPGVGQLFGFYVSAQHASGGTSVFATRPFFCVEPANGTSIGGSSYAAHSGDGGGLLSLWQNGEYLQFLYTGSTWLLVNHNFIKQVCRIYVSDDDNEVSNGGTKTIDFDTASADPAGLHNGTNAIWLKRQGAYDAFLQVTWPTNSSGIRLALIGRSVGNEIARENVPASTDPSQPIHGTFYDGVAGTSISATVLQNSGDPLTLPQDSNHLMLIER